MREIITAIMISGNITASSNCALVGGVPTGIENIDVSIKEYKQ